MDLEVSSPPRDLAPCCSCGCGCSSICGSTGSWLRCVKRKYDELEDGYRFTIPGLELAPVARVQVENEIVALREMVTSQQETIKDLCAELDEERNASESAANEAMSMILRLQREKAEIQMEARQFKRFAEEKMEHDQEEIAALDEVLYKREQVIQSLTCEVQAYKHRMLSYGLTETEADGENFDMLENPDDQLDLLYEYPPLKCNTTGNSGPFDAEDGDEDIEKYASGEIPHRREELKSLEYRIGEMERSSSHSELGGDLPVSSNIPEKVIFSQSPQQSRHFRGKSNDSLSLLPGVGREDYTSSRNLENPSELEDDASDRVYTVDSVYNGATETKTGADVYRDYTTSPRELLNQPENEDPDIKKLYIRLQALEADRESMRQAIISMRTEKAQLLLLREIAQQLCKEMSPERRMPMTKPSLLKSFNFMSIFKWVVSLVFWRKKARKSKYLFGQSASGVGLLLLLDKSARARQWRCVTSTQV